MPVQPPHTPDSTISPSSASAIFEVPTGINMNSANQSITAADADDVTTDIATSSITACDICLKILQIFRTPFDEKCEIELGKVRDILAHECGHADWIRDIQYMYGTGPRYEGRSLALHKWEHHRDAFFGLSFMTQNTSAWSTTKSFELVFRPDIPSHPGTARILDRHWIDFDLVKDWKSRCFRDHGDQCDKSIIGSARPVYPQWLINVVDGCVVPCPKDGPRFVTLSYTWGRTRHFRTTRSNLDDVQNAGALRDGHVASQIPQTIRDAIELTNALGEDWLWVDSLCIVQDDAVAFDHQLKNMHHIYATSILTIIAKDGQDAEHGLRGLQGLSSPRSTTQLVVPLAAGERVVMMKTDFEYPKASMFDYDERMWTFQEQVFAKRRLTFTNGRVEWLCSCAEWHEHQLYHAEADRRSARGAPDLYVSRGLLMRTPSLNGLCDVVRRFNQKALGFDEDVFNAFSGLHTHLSTIFPSGLVFGHPELFFDISLCWYSVDSLRRRQVSQYYTGDPVQNRLPSWSWMGWDGETIFPADLEYKQVPSMDLGFTQAVTKWYALPEPGSTTKRLIDSTWHEHRAATPQRTPKGWKRIEFNPPSEWGGHGDSLELRATPFSMPRELPRYAYVHVSQDGHRGDYQWYPIPVKESDSTSDGDGESDSHSNFQYLQSVTTRAYLYRGPNKYEFPGNYIHLLYDLNGNTVGGLRGIRSKDESRALENGARLELIAMITPALTPPEADAFLTEEEEEERMGQQAAENEREANRRTPWMERWGEDKKTKQDCYHVLWIEWEQGVAYRKGCGFVLEDKWEELAELDEVEVTLG
ncbi:HET-domain-containing protein [Apiospora hydei]|uniref:HET-domain-containing protein n=1 Tax=Apiospora hydei TaxID=1337664 RepID=A0ABR1VLA5_9PEZI